MSLVDLFLIQCKAFGIRVGGGCLPLHREARRGRCKSQAPLPKGGSARRAVGDTRRVGGASAEIPLTHFVTSEKRHKKTQPTIPAGYADLLCVLGKQQLQLSPSALVSIETNRPFRAQSTRPIATILYQIKRQKSSLFAKNQKPPHYKCGSYPSPSSGRKVARDSVTEGASVISNWNQQRILPQSFASQNPAPSRREPCAAAKLPGGKDCIKPCFYRRGSARCSIPKTPRPRPIKEKP